MCIRSYILAKKLNKYRIRQEIILKKKIKNILRRSTLVYTSKYFFSVHMLQEKREEIQRRDELENRMAEILENLKTRLLVE